MSVISSEDVQALADARALPLADKEAEKARKAEADKKHKEDTAQLMSVAKLIRKLIIDFNWPISLREDAFQECMMAIWKARDRWEPSQGAWTTFSSTVAKGYLCTKRRELGKKIQTCGNGDLSQVVQPNNESDDDEHISEETASKITDSASSLLSVLSEKERRLFSLIAVEKLTVYQAAQRLQHKLSIVEIFLRKIVRKLIESGRLPAELVEKFQRQIAEKESKAALAVATGPQKCE